MEINQARGYLYEILISHLLKKNHFLKCEQNNAVNKIYKCGVCSADGEVLGRGTHHQIDFVGIYEKNIPFIYPIRLLAECKFWTKEGNYKPVDKSFIREYIGVHKDISENYFSLHMKKFNRFLDVPVIFSAGGFDDEAEKLAWAQGINIVSHSKLPIMSDLLRYINWTVDILPEDYLTDKKKFKEVKKFTKDIISGELNKQTYPSITEHIIDVLSDNEEDIDSFVELLDNVRDSEYKTFLFATTEYGKLINLVSYDRFPDDLFSQAEVQECGIFFDDSDTNITDENSRVFFITLNNDDEDRRFYFQANEAMLRDDFSRLALKERISEKEKYFSNLTIMKEIDGLTRLISIKVNFENIINNVN